MKQISAERKKAFYIGTVLMIIGVVLFVSVFVTSAIHFGDFSNFESDARSSMLRAFGGMGLIFIGAVVRSMGARGVTGSGVVLDPEKAREELEPYSRMAGGMVKDALDEAKLDLMGKQKKIIMIKCQNCGKLNEEDSKFCQECGKKL